MPVSKLKDWLWGSSTKTKAPVPSKADLKHLKPYGDHGGDGAVQLSFTLPVPLSPQAKEAARLFAEKMGLERINVATAESIGKGFTYFVIYGFTAESIDFTRIKVPTPQFRTLDFAEIIALADDKSGRKIVVGGATTGSDAHTVGIDAILNRKGYAGDFGLEAYPCFHVVNLRAQVENEELGRRAACHGGDAILVSKLVTQQDQHLKDLKDLLKVVKQDKTLPPHVLKIAGGPRITHEAAVKLGFDAGFGAGTLPSEGASFIVQELAKRVSKER